MFWPKRSSLTSSRLPFAVTTVAFCLRSPLNLSRGSRLCLGHLLSIDFRYVFVSLLKLPYLNAGETVHIYIFSLYYRVPRLHGIYYRCQFRTGTPGHKWCGLIRISKINRHKLLADLLKLMPVKTALLVIVFTCVYKSFSA